MDTTSKFKQALDEVMAGGFGEVTLRVVIKNGKIDYTSISKQNIYRKLDQGSQ